MRRTTPLTTPIPLAAPAMMSSLALALSLHPAPSATAEEPAAHAIPHAAQDDAQEPSVDSVIGSPAASAAVRTHTVALGDTVSAIAVRHGLRTADVLAWNDLSWRSVIRPGDVLRLGAPASTPKTTQASPKRAPKAGSSYTVRSGDTLWSIAARHGVSVSELAAANRLGSSTMIRPDQKLTIPTAGSPTRAAATTAVPAASAHAKAHVVATGETLWAIAQKHDLSLGRLLQANELTSGSIIYPGQKLDIPSANAVAAVIAPDGTTLTLDAEQIRNVRTIIDVGRERGVSRKGIAVALSTAMVESWIRNLDWGDRDSLGVFQQRPSAGWGTEAEVRDVRRAAAAFFGGSGDPNGTATRGLLDIPGWQDMSFGDAAQAVQVSAHPGRYGLWEKQAYRWLELYG